MKKKYYWVVGISIIVVITISILYLEFHPNPCNENNITGRNSCYENLALTKEKTEYCDRIITSDPFMIGRMECYIDLAKRTENASLCTIYSRYNSGAICIRSVAILKGNDSICELDDMERDICYIAFAENKSTVDVCNKISSSYLKERCIEEIRNGTKYNCGDWGVC